MEAFKVRIKGMVPIAGKVCDRVGWPFRVADLRHTVNGGRAVIYGNSKEGVNALERSGFVKSVYPEYVHEI